MHLPWTSVSFLLLPLLVACTGPKGEAGPMGPSGAGTPVYYYNNNFDSGGVSEWKTYQAGGDGSIQAFLDWQTFVSPNQSLGVSTTGETGLDSIAYVSVPVNLGADVWTEFDWNMQGAVTSGFEFFETLGGLSKKVVLGFNSTNLYLVKGTTAVNVGPQPELGEWHHVTIKVSGGLNTVSYWIDGRTLGLDYQTNETMQGYPPSGYLMGISNHAGASSTTHIDNLQCYHF